jgi:hypothetical protein
LGNFNPAIFHPEWFDRFKILPIQETQWAEGEKPKITEFQSKGRKIVIEEVPPFVVKPDLSDLLFPSLKITVEPNRYQCLAIHREKFFLLKEVTLKIFTLLSHTPVDGLGINFQGHWRFKDDSSIILRDLFAKKDGDFKKIFGDGYKVGGQIISQVGNQKLLLRIESSNRIETEVCFDANFHSEIETRRTEQVIQIIDENYEKNLDDIINIMKNLIGEPEETWTRKSEK